MSRYSDDPYENYTREDFLEDQRAEASDNRHEIDADARDNQPPLVGKRVQAVRIDDEYTRVLAGEEGTVTFVDDIGTIHVRWDNGSHLGLVPGTDDWNVLP